MSTIVNARDVLLQAASSRYVPVSQGNVDWANIIGAGKPSDYADVTQTAVQAGIQLTAGGLTLVGGGSIKAGQTAYNLGSGFFMGYSGGYYKFSFGNSAGQCILWDGISLQIRGNLDFSYVQNGPPANADNTLNAVNAGMTTSGQITLTTNGHIKAGQSDYATGTGFFLGYSGTTYKLSIGDSNNYIRWSGSALQIQGSITGNSSINITGSAVFNGDYNYGGQIWAVVGNPSGAVRGGVRGIGGSTLAGVSGSSQYGIGVFGETAGTSSGVYGRTTYNGGAGGSFEASSTSGGGRALVAYHATQGGTLAGVAFESSGRNQLHSDGANDITLTVTSYGASSGAAQFFNNGTSKQFWAAPGAYAAYSPSGGGKYYFVDGIGPFTAFHPGLAEKIDEGYVIGDIVVDDSVVSKDINNVLTTVRLTDVSYSVKALGVISEYVNIDATLPGPLLEEIADWGNTHWLMYLNAVGEGCINVCGRNGDIEQGDLIVTSTMPGKGMRQGSSAVCNYTVARAREKVTFSSPDEVKSCACVYTCG